MNRAEDFIILRGNGYQHKKKFDNRTLQTREIKIFPLFSVERATNAARWLSPPKSVTSVSHTLVVTSPADQMSENRSGQCVYEVCPKSIRPAFMSPCWCYSSLSGPWHPSKLSPFDWITRSQWRFHILKQSSNADFGMTFSSRVALLWIVSKLSNRFSSSAIFNFGYIQKSQGAMSGLYGGWWSCTILCFAKNCCTRLDECAGALSWERSRLIRNAVVFFSRHHSIFSVLQRNILCWSSDLLEQIRSAQHPHNRKKESAVTWHGSVFDVLFSAVARLDASTVKIVV